VGSSPISTSLGFFAFGDGSSLVPGKGFVTHGDSSFSSAGGGASRIETGGLRSCLEDSKIASPPVSIPRCSSIMADDGHARRSLICQREPSVTINSHATGPTRATQTNYSLFSTISDMSSRLSPSREKCLTSSRTLLHRSFAGLSALASNTVFRRSLPKLSPREDSESVSPSV
jgi:hypothetical protein